ncbi:Histidine triad nucleotide-binding protein 2, mitochondrial [Aspergillus wentii]|nr:Histidine triad nucleotide-binding protein 2, mitochondrial [Aspergillus wentii]
MPLTKGHVLVITRDHYEKVGEVGVGVGREVGQWLPIISRVVMKTLFGDNADLHWNVVQNNGVQAAQQVPHVHFHIVPRPPLDATPTGGKMSFVMFGRGQRDELDDEEGEKLAGLMRGELAREVKRVKDVEGVDLDMDSRERGKL